MVEILLKNTARWRLEFENHTIHIKTRKSQKITQFTHTKKTHNSCMRFTKNTKFTNNHKNHEIHNYKIHKKSQQLQNSQKITNRKITQFTKKSQN